MMGNYVTVKDPASVKLKGVRLDFEVVDKAVKQLRLVDATGAVLIVKAPSGYSDTLQILEIAPPEQQEKWVVEGTLCGIAISESFDDKWSAEQRQRDLNAAIRSDDEVKVEKRSVLVGVPMLAASADEIPF